LNALVVVVLLVAAIALLPVWRPLGPVGVPLATLSDAPQDIAIELRRLDETGRALRTKPHVWNPQIWGSWLEWAVPSMEVAVDSRIELFPLSLWADSSLLATGDGEWRSILDRYDVDVLVLTVDQDARLRPLLETSHDWSQTFTDADGTIWIRANR
jgi:hypothetical protein